LIWQIAYSELFFSKKLWPDFTVEDFDEALLDYQQRSRRRGGDARCISRLV
jgi:undecaprenyl diphosphate synthase